MPAPLVPAALALMKYATPVLAGTGAVLGGKAGYEQSGGNFGSALLGAGMGALGLGSIPGVGRRLSNVSQVRDAGRRIAGAAGPEAYKASRLFATTGTSTLNPLEQSMRGSAMLRQALPIAGAGGLTLAGLGMVPGLAGAVGAGGASATRAVTGAAGTAGSAGLGLLPDLEIGGVAIGERAKRRKEAAYQRSESEKDIKLQQRLQSEYLTGTLAPFLDQQRRAQVTAQQSLLNTQGAIYQKLARTAGSFQLAGQGLEANTRLTEAALTQNPYSGSVISAPNITFGRG